MHVVDRVAGGISRRDVLRRGAIVGGALWAAPTIRTQVRAHAHPISPELFFCCYCTDHAVAPNLCHDGAVLPNGEPNTSGNCTSFCASIGYGANEHHSGPNPVGCAAGGCLPHS